MVGTKLGEFEANLFFFKDQLHWLVELSQIVLKLILKIPRFLPFRVNLPQFGGHPDIPG